MQTSTTPVPNSVFDIHLKELSAVELKVFLIIIRQTLGWSDKRVKSGRKEIDWISSSQMLQKTGCSRRSITQAIDGLVRKNLIAVFDEYRSLLAAPCDRQGKSKLYYQPIFAVNSTVEKSLISDSTSANFAEDIRKEISELVQKMRITKET